jgi:hypothetical protein
MAIYNIRDNGGNPFKVQIFGTDQVLVYRRNYVGEENGQSMFNDQLIHTFNPTEIFIGKSIINKMTQFSGALDNPDFDGNSILLELDPNSFDYVYIGPSIYRFKAYSKIQEYVSPYGHSGVPYPYATDEHGDYYLMIEDIVLNGNEEIRSKIEDKSDPYDYYYDASQIGGMFENYESLKINNERYTFTFKTESYESMKSRFNYGDFIATKSDGSEEILTKESFEHLMNRFALVKGFKALLNKVVIEERD